MVCKIILLLSVILGTGIMAFGENGSKVSAVDVLAKYSEMVSRLHYVSFHISTRRMPQPYTNPSCVDIQMDLDVRRNHRDVDYFGTYSLYDPNGKRLKFRNECNLLKNGISYFAAKWPVGGKPFAAQISRDSFEKDLCVYLNAPEYGSVFWSGVDGCACQDIPKLLSESADLHLMTGMEIVNDVNCYVLTGSTKYGVVTAWISPDRSYNAVKWMAKKKPTDFYNDTALTHTEVTRMFEAFDFVKIGDVFLVSKGRSTESNIDVNGTQRTQIYEFVVSDIQLNPDFQSLGAFKFRIPDDTPVTMTENPGIKYVWRNGESVPDLNQSAFDEIDKTIDKYKQEQ